MSLLQLSNGFGDIDEVVGDTFGVLGKLGMHYAELLPVAVHSCGIYGERAHAYESTVTGDRMYCVDADANGQDEAVLNNYAFFAEPTIEKKINEIAKSPITDGSKYFIVNGTASQCDKKCQAAINAAMDEIEAKDGYGQGFRELKGVRIKLMYRNTDKTPNVDEQVWYRDFK